jgi:hypothetical protein
MGALAFAEDAVWGFDLRMWPDRLSFEASIT